MHSAEEIVKILTEAEEALEAVIGRFDLSEGLSVRDEQAIKHGASVLYRIKEFRNALG